MTNIASVQRKFRSSRRMSSKQAPKKPHEQSIHNLCSPTASIEQCDAALEALLELSSAPEDQVTLLRRGTLSEYVSILEKECSPDVLNSLIDCLMEKFLLATEANEAEKPRQKRSFRQMSLEILRNFSRSQRMKVFLFDKPKFVPCLLICMERSTNDILKINNIKHIIDSSRMAEMEFAIQIINNLGCDNDLAVKLLACPGLVRMLIDTALEGKTSGVREWSIRSINNIAFAEKNQVQLFHTPGLVETLLRCAQPGEPFGIREWSIAALDNLTIQETIRWNILQMPGLVTSLLDCATEFNQVGAVQLRNPRGLREKAMKALNNLCGTPAIGQALFSRAGFVSTILECAKFEEVAAIKHVSTSKASSLEEDETCEEDDKSRVIREAAIGIFLGLSCSEANHRRMFANQNLVHVLLDRIAFGSALECEFSLGAMMNLAVTQENRVPIFELPGLVDLVVTHALRLKRTEEEDHVRILENGVGLLDNLALEQQNVDILRNNTRLCLAVAECLLLNSDSSPFSNSQPQLQLNPQLPGQMLKPWSQILFKKLGFDPDKHLHAYKVIWVLCSVKDCPHLGRESPLRILPREFIREIAIRLVPVRD